MPIRLTINARDPHSAARAGVLATAHGDVPTPCFMPIATVGAVHHVSASELRDLGASIVLANTYHLMLRPGTEYLAAHGGLQEFMGWRGPLLTDSGGFQVFSLGARAAARGGNGMVQLTDEGVRFRSHIDGSTHLLTPELVVDHQRNIGSDIAMMFDVCPPQPCAPEVLRSAVHRTSAWAARAIAHAEATGARERMAMFGIVQGGSDPDLRRESAAAITALPFDGFAIGGVAVGEAKSEMRTAVELAAPLLPADRPRYLMGVGTPDDIVHAVRHGVDMFDCVLPTRDARHGRIYRRHHRELLPGMAPLRQGFVGQSPSSGGGDWYETVNIGNERWRDVDAPIDPACPCPTCKHHTLAYLRHLHATAEPLGARLATLHNLAFYLGLMADLRVQILTSAT